MAEPTATPTSTINPAVNELNQQSQIQQPQSPPLSISPELLSSGGYVFGITTLVLVFFRNYLNNANKRAQIDNESAQTTSQTLFKQQADLVNDMRQERESMRKERERVIHALECNTIAMQQFTVTLHKVELILEKFAG